MGAYHDLQQFCETVFPDLHDLYMQVWTLPAKTSYRFSTLTEDAYQSILTASQTADVYVGCGLSSHDLGPKQRGTAQDITAIPGLWLDVDYGNTHKKTGLPPTYDDAMALIDMMGLSPTLIVHTGGGFHCWWLFKELWIFADNTEREKAALLEKRWNDTLRAHAATKGWACDSVHDLSRVLRLPGTMNRKATPTPVTTVKIENSAKYCPETDFDDYLTEWTEQQKKTPESAIPFHFALNPDADVPGEKFFVLMENEPRFRQAWAHSIKMESQSEYDLSLTSYMYRAGWTSQEIVNTLIANRRKFNEDLKLRHDYYERTLNKATQVAFDLERETAVAIFKETGEIPASAQKDPAEILAVISQTVNLSITKILNYASDHSSYSLEINGHMIQFGGIENICKQPLFWQRVFETTQIHGGNVPPKKLSTERWTDFCNNLLSVQFVIDIGEGSSSLEQIQYYLGRYIENSTLCIDNEIESDAYANKPFVKNGKLYLSTAGIKMFLESQRTERFTIRDLSQALTRLGFIKNGLDFYLPTKAKTRNGHFFRRVWGIDYPWP